ncbi:MAG: polyprenyl synthetase family protein [Sphingobacteriaceae bacterium]|nr:polyprenyl synthetase family protein [Sphingobacteriaceae bacterium]
MTNYKALSDLFLAHLESYSEKERRQRPKELYDPELYILSLGGKRIRPLLALIGCDLFEKNPALALDASLSLEVFHNFSLIHDDILDKAPLRRNQQTVHEKWNTNIAILSGDLMLVKAFEILTSYKANILKQLFVKLSETAVQVCEGQQMDMNFESSEAVSSKEYIEMITKKTAVLLGCSLQLGAICANANKSSQKKLYEFGLHLGVAFQLNDDLLDLYGENTGKQIGGDILSNKKTYLILKALEKAKSGQRKELHHLLTNTEMDSAIKIQSAKNIFDQLNIKSLCLEEANKHTKKAIQCLLKVKASSAKLEELKTFALSLLNRVN